MNIQEIRQKLQQVNGDLTNGDITFSNLEPKTKDTIDQLIELISSDLKSVDRLIIKVDESLSGYFIEKFMDMNPKPLISNLILPKLQLSHGEWRLFFEKLVAFKGLKGLNLEDSNFDYVHDLPYLGQYLASNPPLTGIKINHLDKVGNKTFLSGAGAQYLLKYLEANTSLITFEYGHSFDALISSNLNQDIRKKLDENTLRVATTKNNEKKIAAAVAKLSSDTFLPDLEKKLDELIIKVIDESLRIGTDKKISVDNYGMPMEFKRLNVTLATFINELENAFQNEQFKNSAQMAKIAAFQGYYILQHDVIKALNKMYQTESKASSHDKPILHNLREDLLREWQKTAKTEDALEKSTKMMQLFKSMSDRCRNDSTLVKDKSSGAAIKNLLLVLSFIFTAGYKLHTHLEKTKESRAKGGHFFFRNAQVSKDAVDEVNLYADSLSQNRVK